MKVLVTGGAGFIGSTIASALVDAGHTPVILDNLSSGHSKFALNRLFYRGDIADCDLVDRIFLEHSDIEVAVHCAAHIVVPESVAQPLRYYRNNVSNSIQLVEHLVRNGCRRLLFSSSAAIYRPGNDFAVDETSPIDPTSPYARSKAMVEEVLGDCAAAGEIQAVSLRYFNPIGADPQLRTGLQIPRPTHALGKIIEAWEEGKVFSITGVDWPTRDGTGIRDYVHVWDLARAHVLAAERFEKITTEATTPGYNVINLGTGNGTTVRELVQAFSEVVGVPLAVAEVDRRPGDVVGAFARSERSSSLLGWQPELTLADGIRDALRWRAKFREQFIGRERHGGDERW